MSNEEMPLWSLYSKSRSIHQQSNLEEDLVVSLNGLTYGSRRRSRNIKNIFNRLKHLHTCIKHPPCFSPNINTTSPYVKGQARDLVQSYIYCWYILPHCRFTDGLP